MVYRGSYVKVGLYPSPVPDAECLLEHSPRQQDYRDKATSGFASYRSEDDAGAESNSPLPPRFQKQQQQVSRPADATARSLVPLIPLLNSCQD